MIPRVLEPEVMDTAREAADYDAMDHAEVNRRFVDDLLSPLSASLESCRILDVGTGTAQIPIELVSRGFNASITAIDLAAEMLAVARRNIEQATASQSNIEQAAASQITLEQVDAKRLPYDDEVFDVVISNSIVHHIPEPVEMLREMRRVLRGGGLLFVRDLLRPDSAEIVEHLVATYAGSESPTQQQLFRQSLHASLTLAELRDLLRQIQVDPSAVAATSDRHWTIRWQRPVTSV